MTHFVHKFLLNCLLVQTVYGVYPNPKSLANLFFMPHFAFLDTGISTACFSNYRVKSNEVSELFGQDYNQCLLEAKNGRDVAEAEMVDKRIVIEKSVQNICKSLTTCDGQNTTLEVFHCHAQIGANNTKAVYSISGNASEYANVLQEKYRILDVRHEQCCKTAERRYVESSAVNYRYLQDCLEGRLKPSHSITATSQATPPPVSTTIATLASSTAEIESTPAFSATTT